MKNAGATRGNRGKTWTKIPEKAKEKTKSNPKGDRRRGKTCTTNRVELRAGGGSQKGHEKAHSESRGDLLRVMILERGQH